MQHYASVVAGCQSSTQPEDDSKLVALAYVPLSACIAHEPTADDLKLKLKAAIWSSGPALRKCQCPRTTVLQMHTIGVHDDLAFVPFPCIGLLWNVTAFAQVVMLLTALKNTL